MKSKCKKCGAAIAESEIIKTDELRDFGSSVHNYCSSCFIQEVKIGFGNDEIGNCNICNSPLVLQHDDEETVSLAQFDCTVHFVCEKIKMASENENEEEVVRLEDEGHDCLILYTIQPDPNEPDFS
ncbi:hypothetical protein [Bacillus sp. FJAT-27445]|uniref:hypothetical protein n=1 Tax=Bacillus sp. FJAT-27445 TaxID=1679166 RepID=UPI000743463C|nr:hypothetical protein [Bacillus sp. FJAT-27445]